MKRIILSVVVIGALGTLIGLGLWQLDRREWKNALITDFEAKLAAPAITLTSAPGENQAWRRVSFTGIWGKTAPVRIRSRTLHGEVGVDFAAPFILANDDVIVVRLGWMRDPASAPTLRTEPTLIEGVLFPTPRPTAFTPDNTPPDRWLWLDPKPIAIAAGLPAARTSPLALNLKNAPDGLTARPAYPSIPNDHLQYAMTWFSLAIALLAMAFFVLRQRR